MDDLSRRDLLKAAAAIAPAAFIAPALARIPTRRTEPTVLGHASHRYRVVQGWGAEAAQSIPVRDCHEMVRTNDGRLFMFGNHTDNNMLIFNADGKVLSTWGTDYPGGHGCTLSGENGEEFLFLTDPDRHQVIKTDLHGNVLLTLDAPLESEHYTDANAYRPTETAIAPNGDIYVADGYGRQFLIHYAPDGTLKGVYAGPGNGEPESEGGNGGGTFNNMHGVTLDTRNPNNPTLLCTARAQNAFKRYSLDGRHLSTVELPGAWICRAVIEGDHLHFAVIISGHESWKSDRSGFVAILDANDRVISCPGGNPPVYQDGVLQPLSRANVPEGTPPPFMHPHDVCLDSDTNLIVPQWASDQTYPVRLERI